MTRFIVGLDLGQAQDFTALCVVERVEKLETKYYHVRHLERFPLGTSYPAVSERVKSLICSTALDSDVTVTADATGVGRPVVDLLRGAGLKPIAVIITGGNIASYENGFWHIPKRDLVSTLQVLLQSGRLKFAEALPEVPAMIAELLAFKVKISTNGHDSYSNDWREAAHDDLVLSLALACWSAERRKTVRVYHGLVKVGL